MPAKRWFISVLPVAHVNGKMAPVAVKCPNTTDDEHKNEGFYYGYVHRANPQVSRFGIRTISRNLNTHPYTESEDENRILFTASLYAVYENKAIARNWLLCTQDFRKQSAYATQLGYAIATCRANGGVWPDRWNRNLPPKP